MFESWKTEGYGQAWVKGLIMFIKMFVGMLPIMIGYSLLAFLITLPIGGLSAIADRSDSGSMQALVAGGAFITHIVYSILFAVLVAVLSIMSAVAGMTVRDKGDFNIPDLWYFFQAPNKGTIVVTLFIQSIMLSIGYAACLLPGIVLAILTAYVPYILLVKPEMQSPIAVIKYSIHLVASNIGIYLGAFVDVLLMSLIGGCCCILYPMVYPYMIKRLAEAFVDSYVADNR